MKRHVRQLRHVQKMPTRRNAAAASSHYLNNNQPDTTESNVCLCQVNSYIVNKIQLQINTLSLETPQLSRVHHLQIHQQFITSRNTPTTFCRERVQIRRYCYSARPGPNTGYENRPPNRAPNRALGTRSGECHDSKRQNDDTTPYLWTSPAVLQLGWTAQQSQLGEQQPKRTATEEPPEASELDVTSSFHLYF